MLAFDLMAVMSLLYRLSMTVRNMSALFRTCMLIWGCWLAKIELDDNDVIVICLRSNVMENANLESQKPTILS